jgi:RNA polymerase sigma-70 factor (ECF subfamily)
MNDDLDGVTSLALDARAGDRGALARFVRATQHDVWWFAALLADVGVAGKLAVETFERARAVLPRYSGRLSARTWLLAIARRVVLEHLRWGGTRSQAAPATPRPGGAGEQPPAGADDLVEANLLLGTLDHDCREAVVLTQTLALPYGEAAVVVGCSVATIRSRVARARAQLVRAAGHHAAAGAGSQLTPDWSSTTRISAPPAR